MAAAVNPDAFSSLSGTPNQQLNIGKSIFYNERINTTNSGLVQVLLVDGSTFTVGPNSNLVIDRFVYDPRKKTGELVATFSKGTMRFIGGKLSKNEGGVTVNTPSGALAIRGGMFQGSTSRGVYSFLFGNSLTFRGNNGQTQTVYQTGYSLDLSGGRANIRPTTPEDTNAFMAALSSAGTNFGSGAGGTSNPATPTGQQLTNIENGADQQISDANAIMVQTAIQQQLLHLANLQNNTPNSPGNPGPGDQGEPTTRTGGTYIGFASGFLQTDTPETTDGKGPPQFLIDGRSTITTEPLTNNVTGQIKIAHLGLNQDDLPKLTSYTLGFSSPQGYNHDNDFLALGADGSTSILQAQAFYKRVLWWQVPVPHVRYYDNVDNEGFMGNLNVTLCEACKFMKFGTWKSDVTYGSNNIDKMGGWWIGTDQDNPVVSRHDMPNDGTAVFKGKAFGTLATLKDGEWNQTIESGKMRMDWNFASRSGDLQISKFGGKNFGGEMIAPGFAPQSFGGTIGGSGASGLAAGAFVGQDGIAPKGVIGNFGLAAENWKANGVFGGGRTNFTPGGPGNIAVGNH